MNEIFANNAALLRYWQEDQRKHDEVYHEDIFNGPLEYRLSHALKHFTKYCTRFAEEGTAQGERSQKTVIDTALIALGAANALRLNLQRLHNRKIPSLQEHEVLARLVGPTGRLGHHLEKRDHHEIGGPDPNIAVLDLFTWIFAAAELYGVELDFAIRERRKEICDSHRNFQLNKAAIR